MTHISPVQQRLRITFAKLGPLKYTSNLDMVKVWERVLRRAKLPIMYTQGFNTRPRIQLASPLPLGITSDCELLDVALRERIEITSAIKQTIESVSPTGLMVMSIEEVEVNAPAMQALIRSGEYRIRFEESMNRQLLEQQVDTLLQSDKLIKSKERKGRKTVYDLRPLIYSLSINADGDLIAHLAVGDKGNVRPDEIIEALGLGEQASYIHRFKLHIEDKIPL